MDWEIKSKQKIFWAIWLLSVLQICLFTNSKPFPSSIHLHYPISYTIAFPGQDLLINKSLLDSIGLVGYNPNIICFLYNLATKCSKICVLCVCVSRKHRKGESTHTAGYSEECWMIPTHWFRRMQVYSCQFTRNGTVKLLLFSLKRKNAMRQQIHWHCFWLSQEE